MVALKQVLKVACPEQKKKDQVLYVWNYHHDLQLPNITEEMKQLWSNISVKKKKMRCTKNVISIVSVRYPMNQMNLKKE